MKAMSLRVASIEVFEEFQQLIAFRSTSEFLFGLHYL